MSATDPVPDPATSMKASLLKELKLPTAVLGIDASPDGTHLFAACLDGGVYDVNPDTGRFEQFGKHDSYASGAVLLPQSQMLISAGYDGVLLWHDLARKEVTRRVQAHRFWSWKAAVSSDEARVASVTGQYLAGGYKYEPGPEQEPSVKIFDARTGEMSHCFSHVPPVLSVAFTPDGQFLAAANMMGEVRVWDLRTHEQVAKWSTPDFTSWGTVKSHHYIGGIFSMVFTPDGEQLLVCGMGPMSDPMAGNGKQTWQRFAWREAPVKKTGEIADGDRGNGLMETLDLHPAGQVFLMAGRLAQGKWNTAFFDGGSGKLLHSLDAKMRVTSAQFALQGQRLILAGAVGQEKKKDETLPAFGRIKIYDCASTA